MKDHNVTTLNCPSDVEFISGILHKLSIGDRVDLCRKLNLAIPGIWPLISRSLGNSKLSEDFSIFFTENSFLVMREYCKQKSHLILPKHIIINCNGRKIYVSSKNTKPPQSCLLRANLVILERQNYYNISLKSYLGDDPTVQEEENLSPDDLNEAEVSRQVQSQLNDVLESNENSTDDDMINIQLSSNVNGTMSSRNNSNNIPPCIDSSVGTDLSNVNSSRNDPPSCENEPSTSCRNETISNFLNENQDENETLNDSCRTASPSEVKYMNIFMNPEKLCNKAIQNLAHCSKEQFLFFVDNLKPYMKKEKHEYLSVYSQAFLFRLKLATNWSQGELSACFGIDESSVRNIFWKIVKIFHQHLVAIPNILGDEDAVEQIYKVSAENQDTFYNTLGEVIPDPMGLGRRGIFFACDSTYMETHKSSDSELNKALWYPPYGVHIIKLMTFCNLEPKVVYIVPNCASESPASGDANLLGHLIKMQDDNSKEALRKLAKGTKDFFGIFIFDAGYQYSGNMKRPIDVFTDIREMLDAEGAVFLGTKRDEYILYMEDGKLKKKEFDPELLTAIDNTVKYIRFARCKNENLHAGLKQKFQILRGPLALSYLDDLNTDSNLSKVTALTAVCCGLYNQEHPGFPVQFLKEEQKVWKAKQILQNFNTENFLQHVDVTKMKGWKEIPNDSQFKKYNVPYLKPEKFDQIIEVTGSIHALRRGLCVSIFPFMEIRFLYGSLICHFIK